MKARAVLVDDRVEFLFEEWRGERGRMSSIELEVMKRVGFLSLDPTTEVNRLWRKEPLEPFSAANVRGVLGVLRSFKLEVTLDEGVRTMLKGAEA